jgi:hypothetical protein
VLDHRPRRLGGDVGGGQAGAAGGDDDVDAPVDRRAEDRLQRRGVIGPHERTLDGETELTQPLGQRLPAAVFVHARGRPVGGGHDDGARVRR